MIKLLGFPTYAAPRRFGRGWPDAQEALRSLVHGEGPVPLEAYPQEYLEIMYAWVRWDHPMGSYGGPGAYELADALEAYVPALMRRQERGD